MLEKMKSAWRIPELRKKITYTFGMLLVYRLLCVIPVPGIDIATVAAAVKDYSILDFMNMMTGGSFQSMSIMAMGITPYINSSIILQLLTVASLNIGFPDTVPVESVTPHACTVLFSISMEMTSAVSSMGVGC
mgnify:CR=1 FL=1